MHSSAKPQIPHHSDAQTIERALSARQLRANSVEVQQRLTGVLISPITTINHRHATRGRELRDRTVLGMPHDDDVGVTTQYASGVIKRLTLSNGRVLKTGCFTDLTAQQVKGAAKTDSGPGGRLKKHGAKDGAIEYAGNSLAMRIGSHGVGNSEQPLNISPLKLTDAQNMAACLLYTSPSPRD